MSPFMQRRMFEAALVLLVLAAFAGYKLVMWMAG